MLHYRAPVVQLVEHRAVTLACVASVSVANFDVLAARKLGRKQKKERGGGGEERRKHFIGILFFESI